MKRRIPEMGLAIFLVITLILILPACTKSVSDDDKQEIEQAIASTLTSTLTSLTSLNANDSAYADNRGSVLSLIDGNSHVKVKKIEIQADEYLATCVVSSPAVGAAFRLVMEELDDSECTYEEMQEMILGKVASLPPIETEIKVRLVRQDGDIMPIISDDLINAYMGGFISFLIEYMQEDTAR